MRYDELRQGATVTLPQIMAMIPERYIAGDTLACNVLARLSRDARANGGSTVFAGSREERALSLVDTADNAMLRNGADYGHGRTVVCSRAYYARGKRGDTWGEVSMVAYRQADYRGESVRRGYTVRSYRDGASIDDLIARDNIERHNALRIDAVLDTAHDADYHDELRRVSDAAAIANEASQRELYRQSQSPIQVGGVAHLVRHELGTKSGQADGSQWYTLDRLEGGKCVPLLGRTCDSTFALWIRGTRGSAAETKNENDGAILRGILCKLCAIELPPINGIGMYGDYPSVPGGVLSHGQSIIVPRSLPPRLTPGKSLLVALASNGGKRAATREIRRLQGLGRYASIAAYHNLIMAQRAINDYIDSGGIPGIAMQARAFGIAEGLSVLSSVQEEYELLMIGVQSL